MNTTKALQTLSRRMDKATKQEREAFNYLVDYVSKNQKQTLIEYEIFAKLYIHVYGKFIQHYQTTVFDPIPQRELHKILDKPTKQIVLEFIDTINMGENYQDPTGKTATWEYEQVAENLRSQITKVIETSH